jgi:hypothetical protein
VSDLVDIPTLGEIARILSDVRQDLRALRAEHVRADVYAVAQRALEDKMSELRRDLEAMQESRRAYQRLAAGALLTAVGSVVVQVALTVVNNKP